MEFLVPKTDVVFFREVNFLSTRTNRMKIPTHKPESSTCVKHFQGFHQIVGVPLCPCRPLHCKEKMLQIVVSLEQNHAAVAAAQHHTSLDPCAKLRALKGIVNFAV